MLGKDQQKTTEKKRKSPSVYIFKLLNWRKRPRTRLMKCCCRTRGGRESKAEERSNASHGFPPSWEECKPPAHRLRQYFTGWHWQHLCLGPSITECCQPSNRRPMASEHLQI